MAAALPSTPAPPTRTRKETSSTIWGGIILSTCLHFALFALWPTMTAADVGVESDDITMIDIPPDVLVPPAPDPIPQPARPIPTDAAIDDDITVDPTTWAANPVPELPPPPPEEEDPLGDSPRLVPFEVAPVLRNRDEVARALEREYPSLLRDAGIGGVVHVWFLIDEAGEVLDARVETTSGYDQFDRAALRVAEIMEFSPAENRGKTLKVWVRFPVRFTIRP